MKVKEYLDELAPRGRQSFTLKELEKKALTEWSKLHAWSSQNQIEQDLLICRALVDLFSDPYLVKSLAFRYGTAL